MPNAHKKPAKPQHPPDPTAGLPPLHRNAAGIDGGSAEPDGAGPPARSPAPVRRFASLTADLHAWADGRQACRIETVVRASPGVYGIPLCQRLDAGGLAVHLLNARQATHLPGRNTDIADCQWRQTLHTCGLLNRACRPPADIGVLRSSWRPRDPRISAAAPCLPHRHQALTAMHVQRAHVISDRSGVTGRAILRALCAGERDPVQRAALKDSRLKARQHTIAKRLEGNWREAWLFTLHQARARYAGDQQKIVEGDLRLEAHLHTFDSKLESPARPLPTSKRRPKHARRHEPTGDLHTPRDRLRGVDVTRLAGREVRTAHPLIAAIGLDLSRWKTANHCASWRGFCPDHRSSGGNVLQRGPRDVVNRAADALRLAAHKLLPSKSALGATDRRLRARLGAPKAITAMAHNLARLVYRMLTFGQPDVDKGMEHDDTRFRQHRLQGLPREARALNLPLVPHQPVRSAVS